MPKYPADGSADRLFTELKDAIAELSDRHRGQDIQGDMDAVCEIIDIAKELFEVVGEVAADFAERPRLEEFIMGDAVRAADYRGNAANGLRGPAIWARGLEQGL